MCYFQQLAAVNGLHSAALIRCSLSRPVPVPVPIVLVLFDPSDASAAAASERDCPPTARPPACLPTFLPTTYTTRRLPGADAESAALAGAHPCHRPPGAPHVSSASPSQAWRRLRHAVYLLHSAPPRLIFIAHHTVPTRRSSPLRGSDMLRPSRCRPASCTVPHLTSPHFTSLRLTSLPLA
jgi:hypothetical protein